MSIEINKEPMQIAKLLNIIDTNNNIIIAHSERLSIEKENLDYILSKINENRLNDIFKPDLTTGNYVPNSQISDNLYYNITYPVIKNSNLIYDIIKSPLVKYQTKGDLIKENKCEEQCKEKCEVLFLNKSNIETIKKKENIIPSSIQPSIASTATIKVTPIEKTQREVYVSTTKKPILSSASTSKTIPQLSHTPLVPSIPVIPTIANIVNTISSISDEKIENIINLVKKFKSIASCMNKPLNRVLPINECQDKIYKDEIIKLKLKLSDISDIYVYRPITNINGEIIKNSLMDDKFVLAVERGGGGDCFFSVIKYALRYLNEQQYINLSIKDLRTIVYNDYESIFESLYNEEYEETEDNEEANIIPEEYEGLISDAINTYYNDIHKRQPEKINYKLYVDTYQKVHENILKQSHFASMYDILVISAYYKISFVIFQDNNSIIKVLDKSVNIPEYVIFLYYKNYNHYQSAVLYSTNPERLEYLYSDLDNSNVSFISYEDLENDDYLMEFYNSNF